MDEKTLNQLRMIEIEARLDKVENKTSANEIQQADTYAQLKTLKERILGKITSLTNQLSILEKNIVKYKTKKSLWEILKRK